ncbi:MAG: hypothetical protein C0467_03225 [Planctomycetaceae bacterium]|nr:hypothetical protein [Planctomycetaceae bacterium]
MPTNLDGGRAIGIVPPQRDRQMRIAICSPDGLGDFILREPLFTSLAAAGHELCVYVRPHALTSAPLVAPGAVALSLDTDAYQPPTQEGEESVQDLARRLQKFAPELLIVAPFQWTWVEERIAALLRGVPTLGFSGGRYPVSLSGLSESPPWTKVIPVAENTHECEKARLIAASLGVVAELQAPTIRVGESEFALASQWLDERGLKPQEYWLGCVGQSSRNESRNWVTDRWAALLKHASDRHGTTFVFAGTEDELTATEEIRRLSGVRAVLLTGTPDQFDLLAGVTALASGYVGRDTGMMHLAAALHLPVFAVMGGGTWPRFLPQSPRSRAVTLDVPCKGCGWVCHLSRSYCIKDIPLAAATNAFDDLLQGGEGNLVVTARRSEELAAEMEIDAAVQGRRRWNLLCQRQSVVEVQSHTINHLQQQNSELRRNLKKTRPLLFCLLRLQAGLAKALRKLSSLPRRFRVTSNRSR